MKYKIFLFLIPLTCGILAQGNENMNSGLKPLLYSGTEVENIRKIIDGDIEQSDSLDKEELLKSLQDYDIIHLATHTEIDNENPLFTRFYASSKFNSDELNAVFVSDIYPLSLKAQMVVLSSCNTGKGKLLESEGIISLARAFRFAGCPSVIMSLWEIDDISTSKIMASFYAGLKEGKTKDVALREAKLEYLKNSNSKSAAPVFWAAAVPIGKSDKLNFHSGAITLYYFIPALILFLILIVSYFKKRKLIGSSTERSNS